MSRDLALPDEIKTKHEKMQEIVELGKDPNEPPSPVEGKETQVLVEDDVENAYDEAGNPILFDEEKVEPHVIEMTNI